MRTDWATSHRHPRPDILSHGLRDHPGGRLPVEVPHEAELADGPMVSRRLCPCSLATAAGRAADPPSSGETIPLWPGGAPGALGNDPCALTCRRLAVFLASPEKATGAAVVICPGGGYGGLAVDHEGKQVGRVAQSVGGSRPSS